MFYVLSSVFQDGGNDSVVNVPSPEELNEELYDAILHEEFENIDRLLKAGADVNVRFEDGYTPLIIAVMEGQLEIVSALLKKGADVNVKNLENGKSLLEVAEGNVKITSVLLENGANVNLWNKTGFTSDKGKASSQKQSSKKKHLVPRSLFVKSYGSKISLQGLDDKSLYKKPENIGARDPLEDVAEEIRVIIDPTLDGKKYKPYFIEYIKNNRDDYKEFWKKIPLESRRLVDLDNDGVMEYFVISNGMKPDSYEGFFDFCVVLKRKKVNNRLTDKWEMAFFHKFEENPHVNCDNAGFFEFELAVTDLNKDGITDIVFTTMLLGGSDNARFLHTISMLPKSGIKYCELWSRQKVKIIDKNSRHPIFLQYCDDDWGPDDTCHAMILARGYQEKFYHWSAIDGFVQIDL